MTLREWLARSKKQRIVHHFQLITMILFIGFMVAMTVQYNESSDSVTAYSKSSMLRATNPKMHVPKDENGTVTTADSQKENLVVERRLVALSPFERVWRIWESVSTWKIQNPETIVVAVVFGIVFSTILVISMMNPTLKVPPSWDPSDRDKNFREYVQDLMMWCMATDLEPERQGPAVALQLRGVAKMMIREIEPHRIQRGEVQLVNGQQQHISGVMLIIMLLGRKYAPLEVETSTQAMMDFMSFTAPSHESIDNTLARFDVILYRARQRGGLGINPAGAAFSLMRALRLSADQWDRLLAPFGGVCPQDEQGLYALMERLRRMGHLHEPAGIHHNQPDPRSAHGFKGGGKGHFFFPTFGQEGGMTDPFQTAGGDPWGVFAATHSAPPATQGVDGIFAAIAGGGGGQAYSAEPISEQCEHCGSYFDEEFSSNTSSDEDGSADEAFLQEYAALPYGNVSNLNDLGSNIAEAYFKHKKRWRRFTGKPPRRYRKFNRFAGRYKTKWFGKQGGKGHRGQYASFLPPNSFAGGKGVQRNPAFDKRKNPRGRDGKVLQCHGCKSETHLFKKCPQNPNRSSFLTAAVRSDLGLGAASSNAGSEVGAALPGVHFGGYFSNKGIDVSAATSSSASNSPRPSLTDQFLTSMTKFYQIGTPRSETGSSSQIGGQSWYQLPPRPPTQPVDLPLEPSGMRISGNQLTQLSRSLFPGQTEQPSSESMRAVARPYDSVPAAASKARPPPPPEFEPTVPSSTDTRSVEGYPWWERYYDGVDTTAEGGGAGGVYHFRTRLRGNRVGLLIDPGAHGNLIGSETAARLEQQTESIGARSSRPLHRPLSVEGVGNGSQTATEAAQFSISMREAAGGLLGGTYTAPVIPGSTLPPLLGLETLTGLSAIIDTGGRRLILPGPGGIRIVASPGTAILPLESSESGHMILPVDAVEGAAATNTGTRRLDLLTSRASNPYQQALIVRTAAEETAVSAGELPPLVGSESEAEAELLAGAVPKSPGHTEHSPSIPSPTSPAGAAVAAIAGTRTPGRSASPVKSEARSEATPRRRRAEHTRSRSSPPSGPSATPVPTDLASESGSRQRRQRRERSVTPQRAAEAPAPGLPAMGCDVAGASPAPSWNLEWSEDWPHALRSALNETSLDNFICQDRNGVVLDPFNWQPRPDQFPLRFTQRTSQPSSGIVNATVADGAAAAAAMLAVASLRQRMVEQLLHDAQTRQLAQNLQAMQAMMATAGAYPTTMVPEAEIPVEPAAETEIATTASHLPPGVVNVHGQVAPYLQEPVTTETGEAEAAAADTVEVTAQLQEAVTTEVAEVEAAAAEAPETAATTTSSVLPPDEEKQVIEDLNVLAGMASSSAEVEAVQSLLRSIGAGSQEPVSKSTAMTRPMLTPQPGPASAANLAGNVAIRAEALVAWQRSEGATPSKPGRTGAAERIAKYGIRSFKTALGETGIEARSSKSESVVHYLSASQLQERAAKAAAHEREIREKQMAAKDAGVWAGAGEEPVAATEQVVPPVIPKPKALTLTPPPEPAGTAASAAKAAMWPPVPPPMPEPSGRPPPLSRPVMIDTGAVPNLMGGPSQLEQTSKARSPIPEPKGPPPKTRQQAPPAAEESDDENWGPWPPGPKARPVAEAAMKLAVDRVTAAKQQMKAATAAKQAQLAEMRQRAEDQRKANYEAAQRKAEAATQHSQCAAEAGALEADYPWREQGARDWEPGPRRSNRERRHKRPLTRSSIAVDAEPEVAESMAAVPVPPAAEAMAAETIEAGTPVPKPSRRVRPTTSPSMSVSEELEEICEKCGETLTGQCQAYTPSIGDFCPHLCCPHCHPMQCSFHHEFDRITAHLRRDPPAGGPSGSSSSSLLK